MSHDVEDELTDQERLICHLLGQVDALTKALMAIFIVSPGSELAAKALEADGAALANRRDQTTADIEYASGFSKVHETIQGGAAALTSVAGASLAKKLGRLH